MTVAVVIPALNEAAALPATLSSVADQAGPAEVVVVDGGSADATRAEAEAAGVRVIVAERGRAQQMNAGAAASSGDGLLFLHADTTLPPDALARVREALADPAVAGGCFRLRFDRDSFWLRFWTLPLRMRWHRWAFGDRALFVRRSVFDAVGGFPEQPLFEDLDLVRALRRRGRFVFLDAAVTTSARRFEAGGPFRQQLRNLVIWAGWLVGADPARLRHLYPYREREACGG
ncbi:MAG: TIGR04283 family arsenosugar biosynthesis glycosyltransferase [Rhodothermales bacterium]|nr:TIGR04283 family arsenosugar biosynthesis glycosyltransferase [Rhodothermales bacterium]